MAFSGGDTSHQHGSTVMSFKQFLVQQEDDIDDVEAIKLYHDYKADCKKKQLLQFFNDHKEENWYVYIALLDNCSPRLSFVSCCNVYIQSGQYCVSVNISLPLYVCYMYALCQYWHNGMLYK